jgi:lysophospholipase
MAPSLLIFAIACVCLFVRASPTQRSLRLYAPIPASCPTTPLVREATGLSTQEKIYFTQRYSKASRALAAWLQMINSTFPTSNLPVVALTTSGGGYRSLLTGAGVIQGFDQRDSNTSVSGLFQSLVYQTGLSGGAWLLGSLAGNNYPTISSLRANLWETAFANGVIQPGSGAYFAIAADLASKDTAGYPFTLTDVYGRLLSYQLLYGTNGGVSNTLSSITTLSNFSSYNVPYPIITALGVRPSLGECAPAPNATQYELHPYEFGSWDTKVYAFTQTAYLGSYLTNGDSPSGMCVRNFDNLGYVMATSSAFFNVACAPSIIDGKAPPGLLELAEDLEELVNAFHSVSTRDLYAAYPNPFYNCSGSPLVSEQLELDLVDGGETLQSNPIWPLLHRAVDVIIVNDNSADTNTGFPNGSEIFTTYQQARNAGLYRMPVIPSPEVFLSNGLNQRPTFFGCNTTITATIVYLPNFNYTFPSNQPTFESIYSQTGTDGMIANGIEVASKGGDPGWAICLGCAIMIKSPRAALPAGCAACYQQYCYN